MTPFLRFVRSRLPSLVLFAALAPWAVQSRARDDAAAVESLIVQLRPAPQSRAMAAHDAADSRPGRLDRVLARSSLPLRVGRSVAGDWLVVDAGRMLSSGEASIAAALLRSEPSVAAVAINRREQRQLTPDDPLFTSTDPAQAQWWLQAVTTGSAGVPGLPRAWNLSTGAPVSGALGVIAVLDSGITPHAELDAKLLPGYDFVRDADYANDGDGRDNDPSDPGDALLAALQAAQPALYGGCRVAESSSWHGTLIAGQVAAISNNAAGVAGVDWAARVLPVRVAGRCGAAVADIVDGLRWAAGLAVAGVPANPNPVRVITLSYGGEDPCDPNSGDPDTADTAKLYLQAIAEVRRQGALVVVAAGNENRTVGRPASCAGVLAVASLNRQSFKSKYSNFGPEVGIATVGGDDNTGRTCDNEVADTGIVSTGNLGMLSPGAPGYAAGSGTSFAAPVVAGVASLMLALRPELTVDQLEDGLKRSARPHALVERLGACSASNNGRCACTTSTCGAGILDAEQALIFAADPVAYAAPAWARVTVDNAGIRTCAALLGRPDPGPPAADPGPPVEPPAASAGGGALGAGWLAGLAFAIVVLALAPAIARSRSSPRHKRR